MLERCSDRSDPMMDILPRQHTALTETVRLTRAKTWTVTPRPGTVLVRCWMSCCRTAPAWYPSAAVSPSADTSFVCSCVFQMMSCARSIAYVMEDCPTGVHRGQGRSRCSRVWRK